MSPRRQKSTTCLRSYSNISECLSLIFEWMYTNNRWTICHHCRGFIHCQSLLLVSLHQSSWRNSGRISSSLVELSPKTYAHGKLEPWMERTWTSIAANLLSITYKIFASPSSPFSNSRRVSSFMDHRTLYCEIMNVRQSKPVRAAWMSTTAVRAARIQR